MTMNKNADYGNWVPAAMMGMLWGMTAGFAVITAVLLIFLKTKIPGIICIVITAAALCMTAYMQICRHLFDFNGGGVMGAIHQFLADHFPWEKDREGIIIDMDAVQVLLPTELRKHFPR